MSTITRAATYAPRISSLLNPTPRTSSLPLPPPDNIALRRRKKMRVDISIREILLRHKAAIAYNKMKPDPKVGAEDGDDMYGPPQIGPSQDSSLREEGGGGLAPDEDQPGSTVSDENGQLADGPYIAEGPEAVGDEGKIGSILRFMVEEWDDEETEDTTAHHAATGDKAGGILSGDFIKVNLDTASSATETGGPVPHRPTLRWGGPFFDGRGMWASLRARAATIAGAPAHGAPSGTATPTLAGRVPVPDRERHPQLDAHNARAQENRRLRPGRGDGLLFRLPLPTVVLMVIGGIVFLLMKGRALFRQ